MRHWTFAWVCVFGIALPVLAENATSPGIKVMVSVDWEGEAVGRSNLQVMEQLREDYPQVPLLHFINPAYFTKPGANVKALRSAISRVLRPIDQRGLHVHAWKTLVASAGVPYRSTPSWDGDAPETDCAYDCGHSVPLSAYTYTEIRRILRFSALMLNRHGFGTPTAFRTGGWMAAPEVLRALADEGFTLDSSAVPEHYLRRSNTPYLHDWTARLWPNITNTSQPYRVAGKLFEVPDNGCLADYITGAEMFSVFQENIELWRQHPDTSVMVMLGFHHETATSYISRIRRALDLIMEYAQEHPEVPVEFVATL